MRSHMHDHNKENEGHLVCFSRHTLNANTALEIVSILTSFSIYHLALYAIEWEITK